MFYRGQMKGWWRTDLLYTLMKGSYHDRRDTLEEIGVFTYVIKQQHQAGGVKE